MIGIAMPVPMLVAERHWQRVLGALAVGGVLLLPSLLYLFRVVKASPADPSARLPQESLP